MLYEVITNFAAGMSGGVAYVYDPQKKFEGNCNKAIVLLETPSAEDYAELSDLIGKHKKYTGSDVAEGILAAWDSEKAHFVKVIPVDYKKVLEAKAKAAAAGQEQVKEKVNG